LLLQLELFGLAQNDISDLSDLLKGILRQPQEPPEVEVLADVMNIDSHCQLLLRPSRFGNAVAQLLLPSLKLLLILRLQVENSVAARYSKKDLQGL